MPAGDAFRALVTGGNGFIGSVVVRALLGKGYRVRCLVREHSRTERIDGLPIERVRGDVCDAASVRAAIQGCGSVVHLAGISRWTEIHSPRMERVVGGPWGRAREVAWPSCSTRARSLPTSLFATDRGLRVVIKRGSRPT